VIGLVPVAMLARGGLMATVWGHFIGAAGRLAVVLLALVLVSRRGDLSIEVMTVALLAAYLPLLAVEASFVGRYLWSLDATSAPSTPADQATPAASAKGSA
jgi:hypothetical protein